LSGSEIARVELVISNRSAAGALDRARRAGVTAKVIDTGNLTSEDAAAALLTELDAHQIDLIVLAGYLKLIPISVVERYPHRILNIHPALLPSFGGPGMYGIRVHQAVLASGARVSGASVHLVDERYDEGKIVAQWPVPVYPIDTAAELAARVLRVEHLLLPATIEALVMRRDEDSNAQFMSFGPSADPGPSSDVISRFTAQISTDLPPVLE
jgi:phosphoribosylglycinamide formyltransferase 1